MTLMRPPILMSGGAAIPRRPDGLDIQLGRSIESDDDRQTER
jgi:hypothetical protein